MKNFIKWKGHATVINMNNVSHIKLENSSITFFMMVGNYTSSTWKCTSIKEANKLYKKLSIKYFDDIDDIDDIYILNYESDTL